MLLQAAAYDCGALSDPEAYMQAVNFISEDRMKRVESKVNPKAQLETLGASHLLEKLLWENHIKGPYNYEYTDLGAPRLKDKKDVYFSLSHSDLIAVAVVSDVPCGIDIEAIKNYNEKLAKRFFTPSDVAFIESCPKEERAERFTEVWTFKEAMAKMLGKSVYQVLPWIDFHEGTEGSKKDIHWTKFSFQFRYFFITITYEGKPQQLGMSFYNPIEGRYY